MNYDIETIFGHLGVDPELRYTKKQEPVCSLSIGVNNPECESAKWRKVVVFGKQAEGCKAMLKKGSPVFVHGQIKLQPYEDKNGEPQFYEELYAKRIGFVENNRSIKSEKKE